MKRYYITVLVVFIICMSLFASHTLSSSNHIVAEEEAAGFTYTVIKKPHAFVWEIGNDDMLTTIEENVSNTENLGHFRNAVEVVSSEIYGLIISSLYFIVIGFTTLFLLKKNKKMLKEAGVFIVICLCLTVSISQMYTHSLDLHSALVEANYYYLGLMN